MHIGGNNCKSLTQARCEIELFENNSKKVDTTSKMLVQRNKCKTAEIGSKVDCFGGYDSTDEPLNYREVYCRKSDFNSSTVRRNLLFWNLFLFFYDKIYLFGDRNYSNWVYDPSVNSWEKISKMNAERRQCFCAVF